MNQSNPYEPPQITEPKLPEIPTKRFEFINWFWITLAIIVLMFFALWLLLPEIN